MVMSRRFIEQAMGELRVAEMLVQPGGYHVAVRQAHLAVELALKSLLWQHQEHGERGHNVVTLLNMAETWVGAAPGVVRDDVRDLQATAQITSYPDASEHIPLQEFQEADALKYVSAAREVLTWIDQVIGLEPKQ
jgi:HEPN domain-containing protein